MWQKPRDYREMPARNGLPMQSTKRKRQNGKGQQVNTGKGRDEGKL